MKAETKPAEKKPEAKIERKAETREEETQRREVVEEVAKRVVEEIEKEGGEEVVEWYEVFKKNLLYLMYGEAGVGKTRLAVAIAEREIKSGRRVIYIDTEPNNALLDEAIAKYVTEIYTFYKPYKVLDFVKQYKFKPGDVIIIDSLGGIRENWTFFYGRGNTSDTAPTNRLITSIVHALSVPWALMKTQLKAILITHRSPAIGRSWHGESEAPTTAQHSMHDVSMVIRIFEREKYDELGKLVTKERIGKIVMDRYNVIGAGKIFYLPQPVI